MLKIKNIAFLLLITIFHLEMKAQTAALDFRETHSHTKIALIDIIGNWTTRDWTSKDSIKNTIRFVKNNDYYVHIDGLKHGVGDYMFSQKNDSIFPNGTAPNWPPFDCNLRLINENELEINFYQYFSEKAVSVLYKREN